MRGTDEASGSLFSYVDLEERIPARHPLRKVRQIVNDALASLDAEFDRLYSAEGRPSIAPERLLRASLIQILFSVRSERQLMEQMQYNLLFRWFVGLGIDDPVWVPTVFTKNRDRLLTTDMSRKFLAAILAHREVAPLLSDEHFSVDGTLVKAWASMKSFQPKAEAHPPDESGPGDPPGPAAATSRPARATRTRDRPDDPPRPPGPQRRGRLPGREALERHACLDHRPRGAALQEVARHGRDPLLHGAYPDGEPQRPDRAGRPDAGRRPCRAPGRARHDPPPLTGLDPPPDPRADKGYDSADFVADLRQACVTPHVAQKARHSAIDGRTTRHEGYALSQKRRKKIEEPFGWAKTVGGMAQTVYRGVERVRARFTLTMAACNLARLPKLLAA